MRVLITVSAWRANYAPLVPFAWALRAAGHDVRVLCPPDQSGAVAAAGLCCVPIAAGVDVGLARRLQAYREAVAGDWPYPWLPNHPTTGQELTALADFDPAGFADHVEPALTEVAAASTDRAVRLARAWRPHLVAYDVASPEGPLVAAALGIPEVRFVPSPWATGEVEWARAHVGEIRPRRGVEHISKVVCGWPTSLTAGRFGSHLALRHEPFDGGGAVPAWLHEPPARPRLGLAWSPGPSLVVGRHARVVPALVDALAELDAEVVVTAPIGPGPLPGNVRSALGVPAPALFASCAAVVHDGSAATGLTALWAGVPQAALTFSSPETSGAELIASTGAGLALLGHLAEKAVVQTIVQKLLTDSSFADAAWNLRTEILTQPPLPDVVRLLELAV